MPEECFEWTELQGPYKIRSKCIMNYNTHFEQFFNEKPFKEYLITAVLPVSVCVQKRIFDN